MPNPQELWRRITEAMGTTKQSEIAEKLEVTAPSVSEWKTTGKLKIENLIKISAKTGRSIDWLLTGKAAPNAEGDAEPEANTQIEFGETELAFIHQLADAEGVDFEAMVYRLVVEALKNRSGQLFSDYQKLPAADIETLLTYVIKQKGKKRGVK